MKKNKIITFDDRIDDSIFEELSSPTKEKNLKTNKKNEMYYVCLIYAKTLKQNIYILAAFSLTFERVSESMSLAVAIRYLVIHDSDNVIILYKFVLSLFLFLL